MPRKLSDDQFRAFTYKPSSSSSSSRSTPARNAPTTVNSLLAHLRTHQTHHTPNPDPDHRPTTHFHLPPTVPPPIQTLLNATPLPPPPPRHPTLPPRHRRIPGPPPPASWLLPSTSETSPTSSSSPHSTPVRDLARLPGLRPFLPQPDSLLHYTLRAMARNWRYHLRKDTAYLHYLPARTKDLLLAYLSHAGVSPGVFGLATLCGGGEVVTVLELSHNVGRADMRLKDIADVLFPREDGEVESWEEVAEEVVIALRLEELGVAWPADGGDWEGLCAVLERGGSGLRALSLVGWGRPRAGVLKRVARECLGLRWVEIGVEIVEGLGEVEWAGAWRGVEEVVVWGCEEEERRELAEVVKRQRRERGVREWVKVVDGGSE